MRCLALVVIAACGGRPVDAPVVVELEVSGPAGWYSARVNCAELVDGGLRLAGCRDSWFAVSNFFDGGVTFVSEGARAPVDAALWLTVAGNGVPADGGCDAHVTVPEEGLRVRVSYGPAGCDFRTAAVF